MVLDQAFSLSNKRLTHHATNPDIATSRYKAAGQLPRCCTRNRLFDQRAAACGPARAETGHQRPLSESPRRRLGRFEPRHHQVKAHRKDIIALRTVPSFHLAATNIGRAPGFPSN